MSTLALAIYCIMSAVVGGAAVWLWVAQQMFDQVKKSAQEAERARVQLAGCLTAAEGWAGKVDKDSWAWSPAFQAVVDLRRDYDSLCEQTKLRRETNLQRAATPMQRETETALFQASNGAPVPSPRTWDKRLEPFGGPKTIAYEDLEGMFLDQFLLRFFHSLMPETWVLRFDAPGVSLAPWPTFVKMHPWATEMPLLFEQMTGYTLNEIQLNNAIAEWARRLSKTSVSQ